MSKKMWLTETIQDFQSTAEGIIWYQKVQSYWLYHKIGRRSLLWVLEKGGFLKKKPVKKPVELRQYEQQDFLSVLQFLLEQIQEKE